MLLLPLLCVYHWPEYSSFTLSFTAVIFLITYIQKIKTDKLSKMKSEYNDLRDTSAAMSLQLKEKNRTLLENQDYEVNLARLNERNRISKEIHDNIGHMLSRSLLQVGALLTITKEEEIREGLSQLNNSLSEGMDQIRSSIHNMYDDSIDLYATLEGLVKEFTFCPIRYEYDVTTSAPVRLRHCIIAITKEALANIIRHSEATKADVLLHEHPAMYQLIIQDNGKLKEHKARALLKAFESEEFGDGMGLRNICDRVKGFGGNINLSLDNGFRIFISFPKEK
jgi:signal transduction histidine kinase